LPVQYKIDVQQASRATLSLCHCDASKVEQKV